MFIECQENAEQHKIHKSDPGLRSLGRGDGTEEGRAGEPDGTVAPMPGVRGRGSRWAQREHDGDPGQGTRELALCWVSECEADPENWRKEEELSRHTACPFLGIDRPELVKAVIE